MNIYTYHSPVSKMPPQGGVLERWSKSWGKAGFSPVVLGVSHAKKHPRYEELKALFKSYPTVNYPEYELACYLRWLALAVVGGGVMCDYDVMNVSMGPSEFYATDVLFHERRRVPCLVQASEAGANLLVDHLEKTKPEKHLIHWSDMISLMKSTWTAVDHCTEIGDAGWENAKTIHFAHGACHKYRPTKAKYAVIDEVMK